MATTLFSFRSLFQVFYDPALANLLVGVAGIPQRMKLLFQQPQRLYLQMYTFNLAVNQVINFVAGQIRIRLETA